MTQQGPTGEPKSIGTPRGAPCEAPPSGGGLEGGTFTPPLPHCHPITGVPSGSDYPLRHAIIARRKNSERKRHININNFSRDCPGGGGGLPTGWPGVKHVLRCAEPKEHKHFRPGTRPGGSVTGCTPNCLCAKCLWYFCLAPKLFWIAYC